MAVVAGALSLATARTVVLSQPSGHKFLHVVMQEASDALSKTADSDTVSTYQFSSVQLVTDKKLLTDLPSSGSSIDPASVAV